MCSTLTAAAPPPAAMTLSRRTDGPAPAPTADGGLRPVTRVGVGVLLLLAVANAIFLYGLPQLADTDYAWPIRPEASAAFLGAGYLAGVVATALVVLGARRWRSVQPLAPALVVLSVLLLAATALHDDKFVWDYPPTWIWTGVYALAPVAILVLARRQRAQTTRPAADPALRGLRRVSGVAGALMAGAGLALFLFPTGADDAWPWPLTPLLAQATGAWLAMIATALLWCAADLRARHEAFIPYATLGAWCLALLAIPATHPDDITRTGSPLTAYLLAVGALLALAGYGVARSERAAI